MSKIEQIEIERDGNTGSTTQSTSLLKAAKSVKTSRKQSIQAKKWDFTLNNYTEKEIEQIEQTLSTEAVKFVFQEEIGENGTPHLQGCFELKKKKRKTALIKWNKRISFRPCRNWSALVDYCQKEDTRLPEGRIFKKGFPRPIWILEEHQLYDWQKEIRDVILKEPENGCRKVYWFYETTGNVGKSTFCKYLAVKHDALILSGKAADMKYGIAQWIDKNGGPPAYPRTIICDIPRTSRKFISYTGLEEIKNACFYSGKYEGKMIKGNNPHLVIFANFKPEVDKMSRDRWRIKCIGDDASELSDESDSF